MTQHVETTDIERLRLYSVAELLNLPEPEWLIEPLFNVGSLVVAYGPSGEGKSFLALDWALSIAQGVEWCGRSVRQGAVVYVAAEGGRSIRKRISAWMAEHAVDDVTGAFFLLENVQVTKPEDLELLADRIVECGVVPELIVLDTLARCFVGSDENSSEEMGKFVDALAWLQREIEAAVMVVHHTGKQAKVERGSTALRAGVDVMIFVTKKGSCVTVHNNKQKDAEEFKDIKLLLIVLCHFQRVGFSELAIPRSCTLC